MALPRPAEVLTALLRLKFDDKPGVGDHINLWKPVSDHPEGFTTIYTGLDMGRFTKRDFSRVKRQTKLTGDLWTQALRGKLTREEYEEHLRGIPIAELVPPYLSHRFKRPPE